MEVNASQQRNVSTQFVSLCYSSWIPQPINNDELKFASLVLRLIICLVKIIDFNLYLQNNMDYFAISLDYILQRWERWSYLLLF